MAKISLITGTAGRTWELERLGKSLCRQTLNDLEWIVVDQNQDQRAIDILAAFRPYLVIRRIHNQPNLSLSLNAGAAMARAEILGFPDDDSWYGETALEKIFRCFDANQHWDGIICEVTDGQGNLALSEYRTKAGRCNPYNAWLRTASTGLFLRRDIFKRIGGFDPTLGLGEGLALANHDLDIVLRAIALGRHIEYVTHVEVMHPRLLRQADGKDQTKSFYYAVGAGRLLREHKMPAWWVCIAIILPLLKSIVATMLMRRYLAYAYFCSSYGRMRGWLGKAGRREQVKHKNSSK